MPPKQGRHKKPPRPIGDSSDPEGFGVLGREFLEWLRVRAYSERTVGNTESSLRLFVAWCEARALGRPAEVTKPVLERYQRHLFHHRKRDGKPLSFRSQRVRLVPVRSFFKWLVRQNVLPSNPASELDLPRLPIRLPAHVLTADEVERVMLEPDARTAVGVRDRAMLEVFYSTGIRRMELTNLSLFDVDAERGTLMVRQGKGKKDRVVPIGDRALAWVGRYVEDVRPSMIVPPDEGALFLTSLGERLTPDWLTQKVRGYVKAAELGKSGSCHLFRHTMATLMLEGGADVRYIQEMLGHANLDSTEVYTRVSIKKLQAIHAATHPGAKLAKCGADSAADDTNSSDGAPERREQGTARPPSSARTSTAEELLSQLSDEARREDDADAGE